mgnify:FL=1
MKFADYLREEEGQNSAVIIKTVLDDLGLGTDPIRQTETNKNTSTSIYKENGHSVDAIWVYEDGPMEGEGYSMNDAESKLSNLIKGFGDNDGSIKKSGTVKSKTDSVIQFNDFTVTIKVIAINSAKDNSGYPRLYLNFVTS